MGAGVFTHLAILQLHELGEVRLLCLDKLSAAEERLTCDLPGLLLMVLVIRWSLRLILRGIRVVIGCVGDIVLIRSGFLVVVIRQPEPLAEAGSPIYKGPGERGVGVRFITGEVILFSREPNLILAGVQGRNAEWFERIARSVRGFGLVGLPALLHPSDAPEVLQLDREGFVGHV